jgi:TRAP-type C4-dicarboxylate transport system permease small subunit
MSWGDYWVFSLTFRLNRWAAFLAGITLLLMALIGAADVIATQAFDRPIPGAFELTESMMVASIFLAVALAQEQNRHIRVKIAIHLFGPRIQAATEVFSALVTCILFAMIGWFGWKSAVHSIAIGEFKAGLIDFPLWPARLTLALGASLMVLQSLIDLFAAVRNLIADKLET